MPAPGEQHLNGGKTITNPFEEAKPRTSEYTAQEIATLQSRLEKQLGPEYVSSRAGPGGQKVHYLAAEKCIQLANEIFGFNGWSSQIMDVQVDFVDENPTTLKVSLGLSVIVRVTLKDGTFHEDIGYGHMENAKGKAAAFEKAKKEGTTDALKRALKNFGNVLGNCIYDKEYLAKVQKIKAPPVKWDVERLHRHPDFTPVKKEVEVPKAIEERQHNPTNSTGAVVPSLTSEDTFDDEFGEFDEADFSAADPDAHPDEVVLPPQPVASRHFNGPKPANPGPNSRPAPQTRPPINQPQSMAAPPGRPQNQNSAPPQPQTPNGNSGFFRTTSTSNASMRPPPPESRPAQAAPIKRVLNQPSRNGNGPPSAPASPAHNSSADTEPPQLPPQGAGFFSARAANMMPENSVAAPPETANLPSFNPHAESPSIRKTPGVDHKSTRPLTRDLKAAAPVVGNANANANAGGLLEGVRKIGAPGGGSPSPMANRGSYKPPSLVRRAPLGDLGANGAISGTGGDVSGGDVKRQRLNG